ncbi:replication-relaxation family protein [Methylocystis suflitae]|uniref:replication-relaxation family protein n=1 Tax=Methylocystis suflitae TaxID=2951405 RepID=UPI00210D9EA2|nr:replication-relaxation family protein [Methylocystis suflitae]MCQ4188387.1 replication-relaxation family protein [Methylocystis suflitae]
MTEDDFAIIRHIARHRFLRSTHVASLAGRSLDRTNDRLCHLYHAGYIDRPRAQLDYYPTAGSAPIVYALANRGARLLRAHGEIDLSHIDWGRKNREAGRPFIEHQLQIADFEIATQLAAERAGHRFIDAGEIVGARAGANHIQSNPFTMRAAVTHSGRRHEIGLVPDIAFALMLKNGAPRNFLVEIDRGSMPIMRTDFSQTSIERKLRCYLAAHAARLPERQFGWKAFRVLIVTSDEYRVRSMIGALQSIQPPGAAGSSLFLFASRDELRATDPLTTTWRSVDGQLRPLLPQ